MNRILPRLVRQSKVQRYGAHNGQLPCLSQMTSSAGRCNNCHPCSPASQHQHCSYTTLPSHTTPQSSTSSSHFLTVCLRHYSTPQKSQSFFGKILDNLKEESAKNTQFKKSIEEFKKEMDALSRAETAVKAREKFHKLESESAEGTQRARQQLEKLKERVSQSVEDAQNNELVQRASKLKEDAKGKVQQVGQNISQKSEEISKTQAFKAMSHTARAVKEEIDNSALSGAGMRVYRAPQVLRMRNERNPEAEARIMEANTHATGVVLHKDSRFNQSWQEFRDNNPYVNRVMEWKTKLDESDHIVVRATSLVKDKISELFGPVFTKTELSETLTEVVKMDPDFDKDTFLLEVEYDIIPNILEAMIRPDLKVLADWTTERAYSIIAAEFNQVKTLGFKKVMKVLDVDNVDIAMGKVLDEGPVLCISFQAQMIDYTVNSGGDIIEGQPDQVMRRHYVFVLVRDMAELNPRAAWRLLEFTYSAAAQLV